MGYGWRSVTHLLSLTAVQRRTLSGADFLWLVLQHVLPKGFRRARNFGFLHPNSRRLIALLQVLLKFAPAPAALRPRPPLLCVCCGAVMRIVRTRLPSLLRGGEPVAIVPAQSL
jgi:hypothetical protein